VYLPDFEFHEPRTADDASDLLIRHSPDARPLAGGTDLLVDLKARRVHVGHLVSLNRLDELRGLSEEGASFRIGALTTPNELADSPVVRTRFPALLDAVRDLAAPQIRNMATVAGNLASAVPSADLPPILISLHASVELRSRGNTRRLPLEAFFLGPRRTALAPGEILAAVLVPFPPKRFGAAYARFALREANACAVAGVAAGLLLDDGGTVQAARIVLGAVSPTPLLVPAAASRLVGRPLDDTALDEAAAEAFDAASPISDIRGSAAYRREIVGVLARRAVRLAGRRATGAVT
jgi:carbon-monoxide dehydrogenase medium subunit